MNYLFLIGLAVGVYLVMKRVLNPTVNVMFYIDSIAGRLEFPTASIAYKTLQTGVTEVLHAVGITMVTSLNAETQELDLVTTLDVTVVGFHIVKKLSFSLGKVSTLVQRFTNRQTYNLFENGIVHIRADVWTS